MQREGGVAEPRVAVIPVARPAELLGQARGGRGDDCSGRLVREQLQRERRSLHHLAPAAAVIGLGEPARQYATVSRTSSSVWRGLQGRGTSASSTGSTTKVAVSPAESVKTVRTPARVRSKGVVVETRNRELGRLEDDAVLLRVRHMASLVRSRSAVRSRRRTSCRRARREPSGSAGGVRTVPRAGRRA